MVERNMLVIHTNALLCLSRSSKLGKYSENNIIVLLDSSSKKESLLLSFHSNLEEKVRNYVDCRVLSELDIY